MRSLNPPSSRSPVSTSFTSVCLLSAPDAGQPPALKLAAVLHLPELRGEQPAPGLVVAHGAGSCAACHEDFCMEACSQGLAVLAVDFRGHGGSEGVADGPLEQDVLAATAFLRRHPAVNAERVGYRGSSMGAFYGLKAASQAGFAAMVLVCPASEDTMIKAIISSEAAPARGNPGPDAEAAVETAMPAPPARWDFVRLHAYFECQDSGLLAAGVTCPVLLVHARDDEVVPFKHSLFLAGQMLSETTLLALPGGSHGTAQHDPAVHRYSAGWLAAKLKH